MIIIFKNKWAQQYLPYAAYARKVKLNLLGRMDSTGDCMRAKSGYKLSQYIIYETVSEQIRIKSKENEIYRHMLINISCMLEGTDEFLHI